MNWLTNPISAAIRYFACSRIEVEMESIIASLMPEPAGHQA
jgi:hypothetical protein